MSRKLIAVDCDGTFFDATGYPSSITYKTVQRLVSAGHEIVAVTGRSRYSANDRLAQVPGMRYLVCSNGAYAWDMQEKRLAWDTTIPASSVVDIVSRLSNAFDDVAFSWEAGGGLNSDNKFIELAGGINEVERGGLAGELGSEGLYKLKVRREGVSDVALQMDCAALLGEKLCEIAISGVPFIEMMALGSDKSSGLAKTAAMLNIKATHTIAFGDNYNDLPMFQWAAHAVAMGNASLPVQAQADAVTLSNIEDGVAHHIDSLFQSGVL